ncbi:MAG: hypothetical protein ABI488_19195 [Polyangiaceae bacterium]
MQNWDFHWQRMYFYETPPALDASRLFNVTCDDDTSISEPVTPGWARTGNVPSDAVLQRAARRAAMNDRRERVVRERSRPSGVPAAEG